MEYTKNILSKNIMFYVFNFILFYINNTKFKVKIFKQNKYLNYKVISYLICLYVQFMLKL